MAWVRRVRTASGATAVQIAESVDHSLNGRSFAGPDTAWQDLVRGMRSQSDPMHPYDWVEGPLLLNPQDFVAGKPPVTGGHQISVHTPDAVDLMNRSLTDHDASH